MIYSFFPALPCGGLSQLALQDRAFFGSPFQIFLNLRHITGLRAHAKVLSLLARLTLTQDVIMKCLLSLLSNLSKLFWYLHPLITTSSPPTMASLDQQLQEALAAINGLTEKVQSLTSNLDILWNENQALHGNAPHLHVLLLCHNLYIPLCSHHHNTLHPDFWAHAHYQPHHEFHQLAFPYPLLLWSILSKTQKLCHQCPFQKNKKIWKFFFTHAFYTSTDNPQNLVPSKTRLPGFFHTCKPVQLAPGENTSWPRSSKRPYGITPQMNYCKKSSIDLGTWTNEPLCPLKFELWCKETGWLKSMSKILRKRL